MQLHPKDKIYKTIVIKCGGSILNDPSILYNMIQDLIELRILGYKLILVHGGGPDIQELCTKFNLKSDFINGLRVTTLEILSVTQMALLGKTNTALVHSLNQAQITAIGLSGHDANLMLANFIDEENLGYVGVINGVNNQLLNSLLELEILPVIAPLAIDNDGNTLNVNADLAAAAVAIAMNANQLILLSDVDGYYTNYPDKNSLIQQITTSEINHLLKINIVSDGMHPKLSASLNAVMHGVDSAHIINGNQMHGLLEVVQNPKNIGTTIIKGDKL